ncbi:MULTISPECIES: integrase domain-containing protein [unclassified Colwellia]|uniref:integrase domain-containing protein n=1 Tax=unclassified Colwellia TaxID=196834 RepID=UPI0015F3822E|nr:MULTISPECIES: integrase domain-containing protein [unclassified Colwellia]MBA6379679.1 tyrosine-type recombinase/integrase [Colwellia sp. BRX10-7]MBA6388506.1 tyrosine-type recombinase/integrase [Colwellia sp. BRX10-2]MBA6402980.1 tyrosine-type recombinase/integrase [Colwellia sp. BRX10-5]MBA6406297.1 tyrosine-type recombinase/integrase [Colwellia sp. BRX10-1]
MAKIVTPLTDKAIKAYKPKDKEYSNADGDGLYLRVKPNGSKLWIYLYKHPISKKNQSLSFGKYPDLSLANARGKRTETRELLANKFDPKEYRDKKIEEQNAVSNNTLEKISLKWFEIKKPQVTEGYAENIWNSLCTHIFTGLGNVAITDITAPLVIEQLNPLAAKGSLETVKRVCQRMNEIMVYAVNTGVIHHNTLSGIKSAFLKPTKQHLPTILPSQLPQFLQTLNVASIKRVTRCLIEFQLHTMVRPSEAAGAKWSEINEDNRIWTIPAERMKKKKVHIVPLSDQALALLQVVKVISRNREHVFPADRDPKNHMNSQTANMAIKRMGYKDVMVAHGMRSLASTILNENRFDYDVIESALAHSDKNEVRAAYNRANYLDSRKELMQWWSNHIDDASKGVTSIAKAVDKGLGL